MFKTCGRTITYNARYYKHLLKMDGTSKFGADACSIMLKKVASQASIVPTSLAILGCLTIVHYCYLQLGGVSRSFLV
jgi:hypothetical protein